VKRAQLVGDKRALPFLHELEEETGCGRRKDADCNPCLREGPELKMAIKTIEQRATLGAESKTAPEEDADSKKK